jgi:hypothetical protein
MLDVFNNDAFSVVALTDAINKPKFVPGRLGQLGLFRETPVAVTTVVLEEKDGTIVLVPPTPRGGPGTTMDKPKRGARAVVIPHFEIDDAVMAAEVQNVRPFGQETGLETVQTVIAERLVSHRGSHEATLEYARVGAVTGVITYADGTTLDLFNLFGVAQEAEVDFDLDNANPASGALAKKCNGVIRLMGTNLGGIPFSGARALCGDAFFDDLRAHPEVRATYLNTPQAEQLRQAQLAGDGMIYGFLDFGGILWENYRGSVGATTFVNTDKCHIFPNAPGLFRTYFGPADYVETVNTLGQRMYAKQYPMDNDKGVNLDTQMNALNLCTRPKSLIKGKRT